MRKFPFIVVFLLSVIVLLGSKPSPTAAQAGPGTPSVTPGPSPLPIYPIGTVTPRADGSLIHVVQSGQTLVGIAEAYDIPLEDLLALNGLTRDAVIFPGDELLIRPPFTPMPTDLPTGTATATRQPTTTRRPTRTPTPEADPLDATADPEGAGEGATPTPPDPAGDTVGTILLAAIGVLAVTGVTLMLVGSLLKRRG